MILPAPTPRIVLGVIGTVIAIMAVSYIGAMALAFIHLLP